MHWDNSNQLNSKAIKEWSALCASYRGRPYQA